MRWLRREVEATGRVGFVHAEVSALLKEGNEVQGAILTSGKTIRADLTILASGAWTGNLIDSKGHLTATGQVLAYLDLTPSEQERLKSMPTILNMSTGLFIITPWNWSPEIAAAYAA